MQVNVTWRSVTKWMGLALMAFIAFALIFLRYDAFAVEAYRCDLSKVGSCFTVAKFSSRMDCETFAKRANWACDERNPQVAICRPNTSSMSPYSCDQR